MNNKHENLDLCIFDRQRHWSRNLVDILITLVSIELGFLVWFHDCWFHHLHHYICNVVLCFLSKSDEVFGNTSTYVEGLFYNFFYNFFYFDFTFMDFFSTFLSWCYFYVLYLFPNGYIFMISVITYPQP